MKCASGECYGGHRISKAKKYWIQCFRKCSKHCAVTMVIVLNVAKSNVVAQTLLMVQEDPPPSFTRYNFFLFLWSIILVLFCCCFTWAGICVSSKKELMIIKDLTEDL